MKGKICLITGANSGIGKATAQGLAAKGAQVVMLCRDRAKGEAARADIMAASGSHSVDLLIADLASQQSIRLLAHDFKANYSRLDVLVNNAGLYMPELRRTADGYEMTFGVNHLGAFLLTTLLLDILKASAPARVVTLSSSAASKALDFDNLQGEQGYNGMEAYGQSKLANMLFTVELARRLQGTGVTANCVHPGFIQTEFGRNNGWLMKAIIGSVARPLFKPPEKGAQPVIYLATSPEVEGVSGKHFNRMKPGKMPVSALDPVQGERLWKLSEMLAGMAG